MPPDGLQSRRKADSAAGQQKAASLPGAGVQFPVQLKAAAFLVKEYTDAPQMSIYQPKNKRICARKRHISFCSSLSGSRHHSNLGLQNLFYDSSRMAERSVQSTISTVTFCPVRWATDLTMVRISRAMRP